MRPRRDVLLAAGSIALLAGLWIGRNRVEPGDRRPSSAERPAAVAHSPERLAVVDSSLRALEDGDSVSPRDRWDPAYVVAVEGRDPDRLFAWVVENTDWIPYIGALRGPVGVLMDRQGNSLDRALLLARLLEIAGHSVRLAHGQLSTAQARALLPDLAARTAGTGLVRLDSESVSAAEVQAVAARYDLNSHAIEHSLEAQSRGVARMLAELQSRVHDQSDRLRPALPAYDPDAEWRARMARALAALRDHWWVQRVDGQRWVNLDPLAGGIDSTGDALIQAGETMTPTALPPGLRHDLIVRVIREQWTAVGLSELPVLEHVLQPADLNGQPIVLQSWPGRWPTQLNPEPDSAFGLRSAALDQHQWGFALAVAGKPVAQAVLGDDGNSVQPTRAGGLGGLGAATGRAGGARGLTKASELTAVWIVPCGGGAWGGATA